MALFKKKSEKNTVATVIPEVLYKSLRKELKDAVNEGSKDVKKITFVLDNNDEVNFYTDGANVRYASDNEHPLDLSRLQWEDLSLSDADQDKITVLSKNTETAKFYHDIVTDFPEIQETLNNIIFSYTVSSGIEATKHKITKIIIALVFPPSNDLYNESLLNFTIDEFCDHVDKYITKEENVLKSIGDNTSYSRTVHSGNDFVPNNAIERMIVEAANVDASIQNIHDASIGFIWAEVLDKLSKLAWEKKIVIDQDDESIDDESLPDFDVEDTIEEENSVASIDDPVKNSVFHVEEDDWEFAHPPKDDTQDDGSFEFEFENVNDTYVHENKLTSYFEQCIDVDANDKKSYDNIYTLLKDNDALAHEVEKLNVTIYPLQDQYNKDIHEFNDLALEKHVKEIEDKDYSNDLIDSIDEKRDESNVSFFELQNIEEKRYGLNQQRVNLLNTVIREVSSFNGEYVQEFIAKVEQKIVIIESVENRAFSAPKDNDLGMIEAESELLGIVTVREYATDETPIFYELVSKYSNPFDDIPELLINEENSLHV